MIDEIMARLASVEALQLVGGAADFQTAVENNPTVTPCAFVIALDEKYGPSQDATIVIQRVEATVGVVFVVRNVSDAHGAAARQELAPLRKAVSELLLGWEPVSSYAPLEGAAANLLVFKDGHMWWQDVYVTSFYNRSIL